MGNFSLNWLNFSQICCSLCHIASLVTVEDLAGLNDELILHQDSLKQHMSRMEDSMVPEQAGIFLNAANHIGQLRTISSLNAVQRASASLLQSVFTVNHNNLSAMKYLN